MVKNAYKQPYQDTNECVIHRMRANKTIKKFVKKKQIELQKEYTENSISEAYAIRQLLIEHPDFNKFVETEQQKTV